MQGQGQHMLTVLNGIMHMAIDGARPTMTRERIDAIRAADSRICIRSVGVRENIDDAVVNAFDSDECEEIEITVPRNHFRDGWVFPDRVRVEHNGVKAVFEFDGITKTDAGYSICFDRA